MSSRRSMSVTDSADEIAHPTPGRKHSSHQPSRTEQFRAPFMAAFMPEVPQASWGRSGVFSHTSAPCSRCREIPMS